MLFLGVFVSTNCFASEVDELKKEVKELRARIIQLEKRLDVQQRTVAAQEGEIEQIKETGVMPQLDGIKLGAGSTFIIQGTSDANATSKKGEDVTDASYSMSLEFEKEVGNSGLAFLHIETGDGEGIEDELTLFSNVNRDQDDSGNAVNVTEAWYEHYLLDDQFTLTLGKIDATCYLDQNEFANDECGQFLGRIFRNASTLDFPDNNAGIRGLLTLENTPWLEVETQALDGDGDWEDVGDNLFLSGQLNFKPSLMEDREGNYRLYAWTNRTNHLLWDDQNQQWENNWGFGISADQEITDTIGLFTRYGWQDPDVYVSGADFSLEHSLSGGCQILGSLWGRDDDLIGLGLGLEMPSDEYKEYYSRKADDEGHFEAYYSCKINDSLTISPDFHMIWDAYGNDVADRDDTIYVFGTRAQVDF